MSTPNISLFSSKNKAVTYVDNSSENFEKIKAYLLKKKAKLAKQPPLLNKDSLFEDKELLKLLLYKASQVTAFDEDIEKLLSNNTLRNVLNQPGTDVLFNSEASTNTIDFLVTLREVIHCSNKQAIIGPTMYFLEEILIWLSKEIGDSKREYTCLIFTDAANQIIDYECAWSGTISNSPCFPREIIEKMLKKGASGLIIAHNHPHGDAKPSNQDLEIAKKLSKTLKCIDSTLLDFIILSKKGFYSLRRNSKLKL